MTAVAQFSSPLQRARRVALIAAGAGVLLIALGWILSPQAFYRAYMHGWLLWLGVSLGAMGLAMIVHLLGSAWGAAIRPLAETAAMLLPLMAILFIPIAIGAGFGFLFPWAHADWHGDLILVHRRPYLNLTFFLCRAAIYGVCWIALAWALWRWSERGEKLYILSGPGLVIYLLTMGLFASTDWILALEPHYKSTIFGFLIVTGQSVSALCVLIIALYWVSRIGLRKNAVSPETWNDLATVLLTVAMLWCYMEICQFIVNWMGNTQDENRWYLQRMSHGWYGVSCVIAVLGLLLPLVLLVFRRIKRRPAALALVCLLIFAARALDNFEMVNAGGADPSPFLSTRFSWQDVMLPLAIGAGWIAGFLWLLERRPPAAREPAAAAGARYA